MVEKTTQLPNTSGSKNQPGDEETKEQLLQFMHGSIEDFGKSIKNSLAEVPLNELEVGLLTRFLAEPTKSYEKIVELLRKVKTRIPDDRRAQKNINKVLPLFEYHEFWSNEPVMRVYHPVEKMHAPIETKTVADISTTGLALPEGYHWCTVDMTDEAQAQELYELLSNHYVEDDGGNFRFDYSMDFLKWALNPPGYKLDWIVGVRGGKKDNLFGFISGIPVTMTSYGQQIQMAEINFLCVHKKLREHRLAPMLIKEITRRVNLQNIWQAIYTAGATLPTPFGSATYYHRNLNPQKTVDVGFAYRPPGKTQAQFNKSHRLPDETKLEGLRQMAPQDVPAVSVLLNQHLQQNYKVHINFSDDEVAHWLLPREGVIKSYVVQQEDGVITDLLSFYQLDSHVLNHATHDRLNIAYAMYCVAHQNSTERIKQLFKDMLILAKKENFDVFNLTEVMQHKRVLEDLMFRVGDGHLKHYFYNWNLSYCEPQDIGIIML